MSRGGFTPSATSAATATRRCRAARSAGMSSSARCISRNSISATAGSLTARSRPTSRSMRCGSRTARCSSRAERVPASRAGRLLAAIALLTCTRMAPESHAPLWHGTTILSVRKGGQVIVAGDGQVSMGQTVVKSNARKVRRLGGGPNGGTVIAGFAGATADAFTLFERLEAKLEQYSGQWTRACVELAKDWRTDRYLRRLEAMMAVVDKDVSLILSGTGDVLEPEDEIIGIGSGGGYALAAARALIEIDGLDAETVARRAMKIAAGICVYTNDRVTLEKLPA